MLISGQLSGRLLFKVQTETEEIYQARPPQLPEEETPLSREVP